MFRLPLCVTMLAGALCACEPQSGPATTVSGSSDLPLTASGQQEIAALETVLNAPATRQACSARDIEFTRLGVTLFGVFTEQSATEPWTDAQSAHVKALQRRWEALGGDSGDVSPACLDYVETHI